MAFTVEYHIPPEVFDSVSSEAAWTQIQKIPNKQLIQYIKKWLKSTGWKWKVARCEVNELGCHYFPEHSIWIDSRISFEDFPAVFIHEVCHGIFPQLEEKYILKLEHLILKQSPTKEIQYFVTFAFKHTSWIFDAPYKKQIGKIKKETRLLSKKSYCCKTPQ